MDHERRADVTTGNARRRDYVRGILVLVALAVLTGLEFLVASVTGGSAVFLFILALLKAGVILNYYMHIRRLWGEEEAH